MPQHAIKKALQILGIDNFLLSIHDAAFPSLRQEEIGRGSPYSLGAQRFLRFAAELGFNGVQFGPQGITTPANPSPYDGTLFSRNLLSLAPLALASLPLPLLPPGHQTALIGRKLSPADRVKEEYARMIVGRVASEAY